MTPGDPQDLRKKKFPDTLGDPEYMTLEDDGQEAFNKVWAEGEVSDEHSTSTG